MQTFEESVKSINEDAKVFAEYGLLYYWLDVDKRPLNDAGYLEKCFSVLSKSIRSFGISVKKKNENDSFSFDSAVTEELYAFVAKRINVQNIQPRIKLLFDGTAEDIKNFAKSVATVLEYHKTLGDYLAAFLEEKYGNEEVYNIPRENRMDFASKFLHGCFPECFIPFDIKLYGKSKRLFHSDECVVRDCVVSDEIKHTLFDENTRVYDCFDEDLRMEANHPEKERYLYFCAKVYALCRYLKEHITCVEYNPITLALMIFESVVTMKWSGGLVEKKRVFAYVEDNTDKGKPSVLCAVSEDGKHFFKYEFDGNISDYGEIIASTNPELYSTLDFPAAKALAAFERFCKDECGFTSRRDDILFADSVEWSEDENCFLNYFGSFLVCIDWARLCFLEDCYKCDTAYQKNPIVYLQFKVACETGLPEPYATKHLYDEYMRLIGKDKYDKEELDQMEQYVISHLGAYYKDRTAEVQVGIKNVCPKICLCDFERFTVLMDYIVDDYKNRDTKNKDFVLWDLLSTISASVYCDYSPFNSIEEQYLLGRYGVFRCLTPDNLRIVKGIIFNG